MGINYQYDSLENIVRTKVDGVLTSREMLQQAINVSEDPEITEGFSEIVDMSGANDLVASFSDREQLNEAFSRWKEKGRQITIFYTPSKLSADITDFMLSLVRHAGLTVHPVISEEQISPLLKAINAK